METAFSEDQVLEKAYAEVEHRFTGLDDLAHGWEHVNRVYKLALHIAEQEEAHIFITGMAALLHDLGRAEPQHEDAHHADLSVELARALLAAHQASTADQEAILHSLLGLTCSPR